MRLFIRWKNSQGNCCVPKVHQPIFHQPIFHLTHRFPWNFKGVSKHPKRYRQPTSGGPGHRSPSTHRLLSTIQASIVDATWQPSNTGYSSLLHEVTGVRCFFSGFFSWVENVKKCRQSFEGSWMRKFIGWWSWCDTWIWSLFVGWLVGSIVFLFKVHWTFGCLYSL